MVAVGDARAVAVESPEGQAGFGALGEERREGLRRRRQRIYAPALAPAVPLSPGTVVRRAGRRREFGFDGGCDPSGVGGRERYAGVSEWEFFKADE
jgi:hypothetical protein